MKQEMTVIASQKPTRFTLSPSQAEQNRMTDTKQQTPAVHVVRFTSAQKETLERVLTGFGNSLDSKHKDKSQHAGTLTRGLQPEDIQELERSDFKVECMFAGYHARFS